MLDKSPNEYVNIALEWFKMKYGLSFNNSLTVKKKYYSITLNIDNINKDINVNVSYTGSEGKVNDEEYDGRIYRIEAFNLSSYHLRKPKEVKGRYNLIYAYDNDERYCCGAMNKSNLNLGFDPFLLIYCAISGNLERFMDNRITHIVNIPFIDNISEILFNAILSFILSREGLLVKKAFWPNAKTFGLCLTHDVDEIRKTYQYITRTLRWLRQKEFSLLKNELKSLILKLKGKEPYWTFEDIIELENRLNVTSSFYFLKETGQVKIFDKKTWRFIGRKYNFRDKKLSDIMKYLEDNGWEVGLHGSFYSFNNYELLKKEKEELETVIGKKVFGIRQHNLNLKIPETWRIHERLGFLYDTTLGSNHYVGFRWGTCFPFHPYDEELKRFLKIIEIPMIIEDIVLFRYKDPWRTSLNIIEKVQRCGGVLTLLWHHAVFNDLEFPGWGSLYERLVKHAKERGAWVTNALNIARWWKIRTETSIDVKTKGGRIVIKLDRSIPITIYCKSFKDLDDAKVISINDNSITVIPRSNEVKLRLV